ncbi:MAG: TlyA family RNA methyltransferase [Alphaproteobacteria bacterium]|nr:TlyA family RNA methyltransferase [Alphaproteobacteria bacterium]
MKVPGHARPRLDQLLVARGLAESRARAQALVMAGKVFAGERRLDKPGHRIDPDCSIEVRGAPHPWVSRGGLKLDHGLKHFKVSAKGLRAIDVGASTGGFTDVLLAHDAAVVYAVDVGRGQLAWKLRCDDRVKVLDGVNARYLTRAQVPDEVGLVVCDASFIGLETVLPAALDLACPDARLIALIKPQFEVGKGRVGKGGIVKDPALHEEVIDRIRTWIEIKQGWHVEGVTESPVRGAEGNAEFLICARKPGLERDGAGLRA